MTRFPPYPARPHKSGQARIYLNKKHVYLGLHGSQASWAEYNRLLNEWRFGRIDAAPVAPSPATARTVNDLLAAYLLHVERRHAGTREPETIADALAPLVRLCGHMPYADLRKPVLRRALEDAAAGRWLTPEERREREMGGRKCTWSRPYANRNLRRWLKALVWAEGEELAPSGTFRVLEAVEPLSEGEAPDTEEVPPVPETVVRATLAAMHPIPAALIECLMLTGARPGELFRLTPADLDRSGEVEAAKGYRVRIADGVWVYSPRKHKTAKKKKMRFVLFGPRAQATIAPLLEGRPVDVPIFCPREASNRPLTGGRPPRLQYDRHSLHQAVERGCRRAGVPHFTPYQLRHLSATLLAAQFGPEVSRIVLGHSDLKTTRLYIVDDLQKAARALGEVG